VALKKPSDLFDKTAEENNIQIIESDNTLREELVKVENLSEQVIQLQQELSQKVIKNDLESLVLSQINTMQENFEYLQNDFRKSNKKDIVEFKEKVSELTEIVGNLVENELPKYRKQVTKSEVIIDEKFNEFIVGIRNEIDTKVNDIAEVIDTNLEYFNTQLQETSSESKNTSDTYNKISKILESKVSKENNKLDEYSQVIQSLHKSFVELEESLQEKTSTHQQVIEEVISKKFQTISSNVKNKIDNIDEEVNTIKNKVSAGILSIKADVVINEQHIKNVDKYLKEHHQDLVELKEEVFGEIEKLPLGNLQKNLERLEKKIDFIKETYSKIEPEVIVKEVIKEGLLNIPPDTKNSDPLTPLDQKFVTLDQLQEHYRLFINRIQQQLSTLGGGGETRLKYLDDIVGIATNASAYDGKYLKYNHSLGNFEFADVDITNDSWTEGTFGPYTLGSVGIGTTNPTTKLTVSGVLGFGNQQNILIGDNDTGARIVSDLSLGNIIPTNNFFAGPGAGKSSGYSFFSNASNNTFIGFEAGWGNISGNDNICIGALAGRNNNYGQNNIFLGLGAGFGGGGNSVCIGENAGYTNAGSFNNFIGLNAGYYNLSGFSNNFLGYNSGLNNTNGGYNNFIGDYSGYSNTTGNHNTFIGGCCGISTSASNKIILGYGYNISSLFDSPDTTKNTQFAVGVRTDNNDSRYWLVGNENFDIGIGVTNPQSKLHVGGTITIGIGTVGINSVFSTTDIQSWYYTNKSKSVSGDDNTPQAIYVGAAGTAMFIVGDATNRIFQYTLSTPYDVSTAGVAVTFFSTATQETTPLGIDFNPTGTKMYVCGSVAVAPLGAGGDYVHEYSLSTAWNVAPSSAGYTTSYNVTQDTSPQGVAFGNSGSKMYVVGNTNDTIYQYSLSTPYSLASGVTYDNISLVLGTLEPTSTDISFNSTGTVLWVIGQTNDRIYEFRLGTAWDISTAVFYDDVYIGFNETVATGLQVIPEQNVAYIVGSGNDTVFQYSTNTPAIEIASSGISSVSSIVLNNETRVKDNLYVKGLAHFDTNIVTQGTLQVDSNATVTGSLTVSNNLTVSGGTIAAGNVTTGLLGGNSTTSITFAGGQTSGNLIIGNTTPTTGTITLGRATTSQQTDIQAGVSGVGTTKTINLGTGGASGSFTNINIGPTAGVGTVTVNSGTNLGIGTARATSPLHVVGDSLVTGIATVGLGTTSTPPSNSQMSFELTSNTNLRVKVRGTDGVLRSGNITLA